MTAATPGDDQTSHPGGAAPAGWPYPWPAAGRDGNDPAVVLLPVIPVAPGTLPGWPAAPARPVPFWHRPLRLPRPAGRLPGFTGLHRTQAAWVIAVLNVVVLLLAVLRVGYATGTRYQAVPPAVPGPATPAAGGVADVYARVHRSVVAIRVDGGGLGSGFFYRPNWVVTNLHVVTTNPGNAARLRTGQRVAVHVTLADHRTRTGVVTGFDDRLDLALVRMPAGLGMPPMHWADVRAAQPGETVLVVGSPEGLTWSVSAGVLSGLDRNPVFQEDPAQSNLLQTDAAINPGNSGGPLVDAAGNVLGVVTLRPDTIDGRPTEGLGFALPADAVLDAIGQLERTGHVRYVWLGVSAVDASPDTGATGALVVAVLPGSPAAKAGLRPGDVITGVGPTPVRQFGDLVAALRGHRGGQRLTLRIVRGHHDRTVRVTLADRPAGR